MQGVNWSSLLKLALNEMPNASLQLLPEAAAQRRLEAVSCKALFGKGLARMSASS